MSYTNFDNSAQLISGYLNGEDITSAIFNSLAYPKGNLGKIIAINDEQALRLSKTATGTLYAGLYQLVLFKAGSTAANARGGAVCWETRSTFTVTPDQTALTEQDFAGIGLMVNTKGNYGWIQVAGKSTILYRASVTDTTAGNIVLQLTTTNTFDSIADATGTYISGGVKGLKNIVGVGLEAAANGALKLASIWPRNLNFGA